MIKAKKRFGQHFLVNAGIARRIVNCVSPRPEDVIIEIGAGAGALTRLLVERSGYTVAIELDGELARELKARLERPNLSIIEADALKLDWEWLKESAVNSWMELSRSAAARARIRVVANLPYYISTPIVEKLLKHRDRMHDMTLMLQSEVVDRIASGPGSRQYGYLSVLVQLYCHVEKLFEVPPQAFRPAPRVRSAVVRLTLREREPNQIEDHERFFAVVRAAFAKRRKTILNSMKASGIAPEAQIERALKLAGVAPQRRAEELSLDEFARLANSFIMNPRARNYER